MKALLLLFIVLITVPSWSADPEPSIRLPAPPALLVTSEEAFSAFGREAASVVDHLLNSNPPPATGQMKNLLSMRLHLALSFGEDTVALETSRRIRELQTDANERAVSGLLTQAIIEGKSSGSRPSPATFEKNFTALLEALPRHPEIAAAIRRARDKMDNLSEAAILENLRRNTPDLKPGSTCPLDLADQIIRVRHQIVTILPLRESAVRAYDAVLSSQ